MYLNEVKWIAEFLRCRVRIRKRDMSSQWIDNNAKSFFIPLSMDNFENSHIYAWQ